MRRVLLSSIAVVLLLVLLAPSAYAALTWCEWDPLVTIDTPDGGIVEVHVTNYAAGEEHLAAIQDAKITYKAKADKDERVLEVKIKVAVPNDRYGKFATRSVVSTGPDATGTILAVAEGKSGQPMELEFEIAY